MANFLSVLSCRNLSFCQLQNLNILALGSFNFQNLLYVFIWFHFKVYILSEQPIDSNFNLLNLSNSEHFSDHYKDTFIYIVEIIMHRQIRIFVGKTVEKDHLISVQLIQQWADRVWDKKISRSKFDVFPLVKVDIVLPLTFIYFVILSIMITNLD